MTGTERTFRSPNFYEREIDVSAPVGELPVGTPAGVVGTANKGPAFVPITIASFDGGFVERFGNLDPKHFGPYAVNEFLKNRAALTFVRVLGAGANTTDTHIATTQTTGRVESAGFTLEGTANADAGNRHVGAVQFLVARHSLQTNEAFGMPMFTDNYSFDGSFANIVRGVVMMASGARMMVLDGNQSAVGAFTPTQDDLATLNGGKFKLVISSTLGNAYANTDSNPGVKILTASFDPSSSDYFAKVLNRDPDRFVADQHLLYADFAVDDEIASAVTVGILSGSTGTSPSSGEPSTTFRQAFGAFDTRYTTPRSTWFISQPYGATEYDLFYIESLDDGEYANTLYKISITNIKASLDDANPFGTFTVNIRDWNDTDANQNVLESFPNCSLNPNSDRYIARLIGDRKVYFNFDASSVDDRRVVASGKYQTKSKYVRVIMSDAVDRGLTPKDALPFGFRGMELLKTNDSFTDGASGTARIVGSLGVSSGSLLSGSIVPPVPFRFKITKGEVPTSVSFEGQPGATELIYPQLHWGIKFERNTLPLNSNLNSEKNPLLESFAKFAGIRKLDVVVTGSGADLQNNNKFTLAKVALSNTSVSHVTGTAGEHMKEAAYIRNAVIDNATYTVPSSIGNRITLATILAQSTAAEFNKFSPYTKFTNMMYGGWDGVNILDRDARRLNDKSTSFDSGGGAASGYIPNGFLTNQSGGDKSNNGVASYITAIDIMTDPMTVRTNILAVPGIREPYITDYASRKVREYGMAYYVMDIPSYDDDGARMYDDSTTRADVDQTANALDLRAIDNNYVGTYFPNVFINDSFNKRRLKVPASVAALGALGFNDRVSYPWFAPAGFNRAALDFVTNVEVRLSTTDRDRLYDSSRINPIATFPRLGYVIYGQKTMQVKKSALDRVNVRRLLLEVKRQVVDIASKITWEQNTPEIRAKFVTDASLALSLVKTQAGVKKFDVIMNDTNNTQEDFDLNRVNGRIVVWPLKAVEFVAIDFVVTRSGVEFV